MRRTAALFAAGGLALVVTSCGTNAASDRPSSTATVRIVSPLPNEEVAAETFEVRVEIEGGTITDEVVRNIEDLTPHEGHLHASLDGRIVSETFEPVSEVPTPGPGRHLLQVEFVAKDHLPFDPRVMDTVVFTVPEP